MVGKVNIQIDRDLKSELDKIGSKTDTYNDIVKRCFITYKNKEAFEECNTQIYQGNNGAGYLKILFPKNVKGEVEIKLEDLIEDIKNIGDECGAQVNIK